MNHPHVIHFCLLISLFGAGRTGADDLGRLFTSAADRARIDAQITDQTSPGAVQKQSTPDKQIINGTLIGSGGKRLVWINGAQLVPGHNAASPQLLHDGRVQLPWHEGESPRELKPGQGLDQTTGEVFELYMRAPAPTPELAATPKTPRQVTPVAVSPATTSDGKTAAVPATPQTVTARDVAATAARSIAR